MKLDVDALPNVRYFRELLPILRGAREREWFNGGMVYATQGFSQSHLKEEQMPLTESTYTHLMNLRHLHCTCSKGPEATNFICRREDYLALGGGDSRFRGWGWEDYQQIYMLERYWRQSDPLPGEVTLANITHRCRLEISQPKARELWQRNPWLVLLHRHHPKVNGTYRSFERQNREILLDYISHHRS